MNRRALYGVLLIGVLGAGLLVWLRARGNATEGGDAPRAEQAMKQTQLPHQRRIASNQAPPVEVFREISMDDDPTGPLRLEGIVIDEDEHPVAGAIVSLNSNPSRTKTSGQDGTFLFEKLVGRMYTLTAREDNAVGGPVIHRLTASSDPVAIRVRQGATLDVVVVASDDGQPIDGATVGLYGNHEIDGTTDRKGVASLRGVSSGGHVLYANAPGFARQRELVNVPDTPGASLSQRIALRRGAQVVGRVLDPSGNPVAGAQVIPHNTATAFVPMNPRLDSVKTDAQGRFVIPSVGAGTFRFVARHREHPPSSTEPLELDGENPRSDIVIVMEMGGVLAGRALTPEGAPVPWARIRVGPDPNESAGGSDGARRRSVVAEEDGSFRIVGVAREKLVAIATSETATSDLVAVDLRLEREQLDLELRLDVDGAISGVVVDGAGEPIAEAQVMAVPDFFKGADIRQLQVRGPAFQMTDGGGRFALRGLPEGEYRLTASRTRIAPAQGVGAVEAKVGDSDVRIELPAEGSLKGKLELSNGKTPEFASVSVGLKAGAPAGEGKFHVDGLRPGSYDVVFRGPQFAEHIVKDVEVVSAKTEDMGTITLPLGRAVSGRVVDANGAPVEGAQVVVARRLVSDGSRLTPALGGLFEERLGIRKATTDAEGGYRISGIEAGERVIAAEHPAHGRAHAVSIPPGDENATVELMLRPFGALTGVVNKNREPVASAGLYIAPPANPKQSISVRAGLDGKFVVERLPAGDYKVNGGVGTGGAANFASANVTVEPGQTAHVELEITTGDVTLQVEIKGKHDATIDAAQVFVFTGKVRATNAKELLSIFSQGASSGARMTFAFPPKTADFKEMTPGAYSTCVVPVNGDLGDPQFQQRLQRHTDALAVYCEDVEVKAAPAEQRFVAEVPPMNPLP